MCDKKCGWRVVLELNIWGSGGRSHPVEKENLADGVKRHILQIYNALWSEQAPSQYLVDSKCTAK